MTIEDHSEKCPKCGFVQSVYPTTLQWRCPVCKHWLAVKEGRPCVKPLNKIQLEAVVDLTVETKQYQFSASAGFAFIAIYICNKLNQYPDLGTKHYLTKKEVRDLIEYLKENNCGDSWIFNQLINLEMLMEGKEKAEFRFW